MEANNSMMTKTAEEYRNDAARHEADARESFDRCDTDGFLSQWASGLSAQKARLNAEIAENGGMSMFPALARTSDGAIVDAKMIQGKYGLCWLIRNGAETVFCPVADAAMTDWSEAANDWVYAEAADEFGYTLKSQKKLAKRGFRQVKEARPAIAVIRGHGRGLSGSAWACIVERREARPEEIE